MSFTAESAFSAADSASGARLGSNCIWSCEGFRLRPTGLGKTANGGDPARAGLLCLDDRPSTGREGAGTKASVQVAPTVNTMRHQRIFIANLRRVGGKVYRSIKVRSPPKNVERLHLSKPANRVARMPDRSPAANTPLSASLALLLAVPTTPFFALAQRNSRTCTFPTRGLSLPRHSKRAFGHAVIQ